MDTSANSVLPSLVVENLYGAESAERLLDPVQLVQLALERGGARRVLRERLRQPCGPGRMT